MTNLRSHVGAGVNTFLGELTINGSVSMPTQRKSKREGRKNVRQSNLESLFNLRKNLLVLFGADKRDGQTLGTETAGTTDTMEVGASIAWQIVVDGQIDALNINTTAKDVSRDADPLLELLELLVTFDAVESLESRLPIRSMSRRKVLPFLLADTRVHSNGGKVAFPEELV